MGLWNMLTQANERGKEGERYKATCTKKERDQKVMESGGGNTVAASVVFHWSLESVGELLSLGTCVVT